MTNYEPVSPNVLIVLAPIEEAIYVPETDPRAAVRGMIVATSSTKTKENSFIWFSKYESRPVTLDGKLHYVLNEKDILLIERENVKTN